MTNLTIGLPVFNAMPFLAESLGSLLRQTNDNFKILVIDDGSTDASLKYLQSVEDPRLRVLTQPNQGLTCTLNRMLREIETPWLMRHDADDVASTSRVSITQRSIERFPDAGMFYAEAHYYQNGRSVGTFRTTRAAPEKLRGIVAAGYLPAICHPTVTLNVQKVLEVGGYRFNLHIEDIDLWWRMILNYDCRYMPEIATFFRHNTGSVSTANLESQSINMLYVQYLLLSHLHGSQPLTYDLVRAHLARLVDKSKLKFRAQMRTANIFYSQKEYFLASQHLAKALLADPAYFMGRVLYELPGNHIALNGENPSMFLRQSDVLWPQCSDPTASVSPAATSQDGKKSVECA